MKFRLILLLILSNFSLQTFAQMDTIYQNNGKLVVDIKEVQEDVVKFTYPNEDILNSIYKNTIYKVVFRSGRTQLFSGSTNYKTLSSIEDWPNVSITQVSSEVQGLFKLGDISSKARGGSNVTNMEKVKERAFKKLKIQAAMNGANLVYMTQLNSKGGNMAWGIQPETSLSALAYSNTIPAYEDFKKLLNNRSTFKLIQRIRLNSNAKDYYAQSTKSTYYVNQIVRDGELIFVVGHFNKETDTKSRVVRFDKASFTLVHEDNTTLFNEVIAFE